MRAKALLREGKAQHREPGEVEIGGQSLIQGKSIRRFRNEKRIAPETDAAGAAIEDADEREEMRHGEEEKNVGKYSGRSDENNRTGADYGESDWGYGSGYGYGQREKGIHRGEVATILGGVEIRERHMRIMGSKRIEIKSIAPFKGERKEMGIDAINTEKEGGVKLQSERKSKGRRRRGGGRGDRVDA